MRLRRIKLAGFKSFVDPTHINLPPGIIGIVGPNGCGKSNVIDAVRWVMGEISARHLRGDSMADVVFNGSTSRRPVGQASVELVFDNSDGRLGGEYATYAEIALRRQVVRDGQSSYYLNGTRCRRRDVVGIFLGTGLGPRSYAIIEQGMISRLIEARPEELREFLEEAAGISKYKERRRETETRLRHCRQNLERLNDVRAELEKQLTNLKRQAAVAEKYKRLRQEQRQADAVLLVLRWRALAEEATRQAEDLRAEENGFEAMVAEQRAIEAELEQMRSAQISTTDEFNAAYRQVLDAGAEIARREENIAHQKTRRKELSQSLHSEEALLSEALTHLHSDEGRMRAIGESLQEIEPQLENLESLAARAKAEHAEQEQTVRRWQVAWERLSEQVADSMQKAHVQRTQIEHVEERLLEVHKRVHRLEEERASLHPETLEDSIRALHARLGDRAQALMQVKKTAARQQTAIRDLRERMSEVSLALHAAQARLQESRGRLASLSVLQQEALGKKPGEVMQWLEERALSELPRLAERLQAAPGWERALEIALGPHLEAVCVVGQERFQGDLAQLKEGALTLFDSALTQESNADGHGQSWCKLVEKIAAPWPLDDVLDGIYVADCLEDAFQRRASLGPGESMVTPAGEWVGGSWVRVVRGKDGADGILAREQEIRGLMAGSAELDQEVNDWSAELAAAQRALAALEQEYAALQTELAETHREQATLASKLESERKELDRTRARLQAIVDELDELRMRTVSDAEQLRSGRLSLQSMTDALEALHHERDALETRRKEQLPLIEKARERWQQQQDDAYGARLRAASLRTELKSLEQGRLRNQEQVTRLQARYEELSQTLADTEAPLQESATEIDQWLATQRRLDEHLGQAREQMERSEARVQELEQQRQTLEGRLQTTRAALEQRRMTFQEVRVRGDTVAEQVAAAGYDLAAMITELPKDATEDVWSANRDALARRIERLGSINLAAIDELEQQSERGRYLDAQHADLVEALTTLQDAIHKIDQESRTRFEDTFERVNSHFSALFERLFGGGHAYLEMTGSDVLDTGVSIMARPPGKRNSTIHLLSGGEKALTAVALVFAIFELNPAPFCLLDEVDAPLDDANVGRFCDLVKEMSERLQLLIVTHNKTSMETSEHLVGVTMKEPGVSRLVAVDVEEAVRLAAM
ncbi:MAG: chromosome segregation protein SMC [Gammaproteobacteria bacterium]|jgi:chromosome segregation protein